VEPIYGLVVMGLVHPKNIKKNADAKAGDVLILSKPVGVGVMSAALKKDALGEEGYAQMIANTTQLNTPGIALSQLAGVHALTDITGFGLGGHTLELARGAKLNAVISMKQVPLMPNVEAMAAQGFVTGASQRNWDSFGHDITLDTSINEVQKALLTDPQTSGGLLVSCAPETVDAVLAVFRAEGFAHAAVVGHMQAGKGLKVLA
jgi:selenide,water dikinase